MGKALLVVNRRARKGQQKLEEALEQLQHCGLEWIEVSPEAPEEIATAICHYRDQADRVIIGGGDGTLNAAIPGLIETQLPLGILPLGTANDLARTLGIPATLPEACRILTGGRPTRIDVGWVNDRYFFNVASIGLSVQITHKLNAETKQKWGVFAYPIAALQALRHSRPFWASLCLEDGNMQRMRTVQIAVGNGRYYGGGMTVANDAAITDQQLDVYTLNLKHLWQLAAVLPDMRSGKQTDWSFVEGFRCREVRVTTARPMPVNTDGEITTYTPAYFRIIPQALSVLVPAEQAAP
ncbi:MAG TPA: lipid kinase [Leptolyngbyaceae cyanobacterium]